MIYNSHKQELSNIFNKKILIQNLFLKNIKDTCLVKSILVGERMNTLLLKE